MEGGGHGLFDQSFTPAIPSDAPNHHPRNAQAPAQEIPCVYAYVYIYICIFVFICMWGCVAAPFQACAWLTSSRLVQPSCPPTWEHRYGDGHGEDDAKPLAITICTYIREFPEIRGLVIDPRRIRLLLQGNPKTYLNSWKRP